MFKACGLKVIAIVFMRFANSSITIPVMCSSVFEGATTMATLHTQRGFTLLELSMVLVVIGLVVGGVLVGQDLIKAAQIRATVTQLERFNTAVNTFQLKYNGLPGDMADPAASSFGFQPRGQYAGEGDGNGVIQGVWSNASGMNSGFAQSAGETIMFWRDLSTAQLIENGLANASETNIPNVNVTTTSTPNLNAYLPQAKIGQGNYIYAYSSAFNPGTATESTGVNFFGLSAVTEIVNGGDMLSTPALTVQQAYIIDTKIDDGLPQSGRVTAQYENDVGWPVLWAGLSGGQGGTDAATPGSSTTCFDNGDTANATMQYSTEISGGNNVNCALSFQMQGAAR
jgi:prepilin-type N-terminal cleavage/methylation domain-containing protein